MTILAVGFFGEGNLGDEAIWQGLAGSLGNARQAIVTAGRTFSTRQGARRIPRRGPGSWLPFLEALRDCRQVIFTGGILQDWSWEGVTFYALRLLAAATAGRRPSLWGAGLGPVRRRTTRRFVGRVLRRAESCWLRDADSVGLFHTLTGRNARLGTDWSWAIPDPQGSRAPEADGRTAVNLRPWSNPRLQRVALKGMATVPAGKRLGVAARREDELLLRGLFPGMEVVAPSSFAGMVRLGASLSAGLAMRYHVLLAWLRAGVPVLPLCYDDKVTALCREAGLDPTEGRPTGIGSGSGRMIPRKAASHFAPSSVARLHAMQAALQESFHLP